MPQFANAHPNLSMLAIPQHEVMSKAEVGTPPERCLHHAFPVRAEAYLVKMSRRQPWKTKGPSDLGPQHGSINQVHSISLDSWRARGMAATQLAAAPKISYGLSFRTSQMMKNDQTRNNNIIHWQWSPMWTCWKRKRQTGYEGQHPNSTSQEKTSKQHRSQ